jgi:hypothetical protein
VLLPKKRRQAAAAPCAKMGAEFAQHVLRARDATLHSMMDSFA